MDQYDCWSILYAEFASSISITSLLLMRRACITIIGHRASVTNEIVYTCFDNINIHAEIWISITFLVFILLKALMKVTPLKKIRNAEMSESTLQRYGHFQRIVKEYTGWERVVGEVAVPDGLVDCKRRWLTRRIWKRALRSLGLVSSQTEVFLIQLFDSVDNTHTS